MKKIVLAVLLSCVSLCSAKAVENKGLDGTGHGFIGAEAGLGYVSAADLGIMGGYHYYFSSASQFKDMRHAIRGYGAVTYGFGEFGSTAIRVGADWLIDFNPRSKYVWGAFMGIALGYNIGGLLSGMSYGSNIGGSFEINNAHRIELSLGYGYSLLALRYIYKF